MKIATKALLLASCLALAACWTEGDDQAARNVEEGFENIAQEFDNQAENASGEEEERLEDAAAVVRDTGEAAAESMDDHDVVPEQNAQ